MNTSLLLRKSESAAIKVISALILVLILQTWGTAQTFNGSTVNTAGNSTIPSVNTGGCGVEPQTAATGGTTFNNTVAGLAAGQAVSSVLVNFTHTWDADLSFYLQAPNGQIIELSTGNGGSGDNYTNTNFITGSPNITGGVPPFTGNFAPEGTLTTLVCGATITPTVTTLGGFTNGQNGTWKLRFFDGAGGDIGTMLAWSITFVPGVVPCLLNTPASVSLNAAVGQCSATAILNIPTQTPANCADGVLTGIRYSVNGGTFVNVVLPAMTVTISNLPVGVNTITWQTYTISNGVTVSTVNQTVTVNDTQPPTIICPSNIIVNLDPGACSAFVNYLVTAVDNCSFPGPFGQVNTITSGGNGNAVNGMVWFNINNLTSNSITVSQLGMNISNATMVNIYIKNGTHVGFETNPGAWTLAQTVNANMGPFSGPFPGNGTITPVNTNFVVGPGLHGIALGMPSASSNYTNGNGGNQTYTDGTITLTLGSTANTPFGAPFTPRVFNGFVKYQTQTSMGTPVQTAGLPSGSNFPIGTTTNCFTITDNAGLTATCCFSVIVKEFANPIFELACNDNIEVSLDSTCQGIVTADMVLEGGPYHCYDDYIVEVDRTAPYGNGPWQPAILNSDDVGHTITVRVTDPETGNSCWGTISVEDKIPPFIDCNDFSIMCGQQIPENPSPSFDGAVWSIADTVTADLGFSLSCSFGFCNDGLTNHYFQVYQGPSLATTATRARVWLGDGSTGCSPTGNEIVTATLYTLNNGAQPYNVTAANRTLLGASAPTPLDPAFAGEKFSIPFPAGLVVPANSTILMQITIQNGPYILADCPGDGTVTWLGSVDCGFPPDNPVTYASIGFTDHDKFMFLYLHVEGIAPYDNCDDIELTYTDTQSGDPCEGLMVNRHWIVTDGSGNTSACDQKITVNPLVLDSVVCPPAYIGHCGDSSDPENTGWPTVNGEPITDEGNVCNIFVGYWDKPLNDCGNGQKIVRTWTVLDWCTQTTLECIQVIKLSDDQAPVLTCPDDFEVGTDFWYCYANVSVPKPGVVDACGSAYTLSLTSTAGIVVNYGNNYVINQLPLGTATVTWHVVDECGNSSSCSFEITVVDDVVPVANCDAHTVVALTNDGPMGLTLVPATVFNDGSYDNCGPVTFRARRMDSCIDFDWTTEGACIDDIPGGIPPVNSRDRGTVHRPCVPFACCDVGAGPVMVELEVTDLAGNRNYCMVEAIVQDKISPFVECPPDIIVSCDFWFNVQEGTFSDSPLNHEGNGNGNLDEDPLSPVFGNMYDAFAYNDDESVRQDIIIDDPGSDIQPQPHFWGIDGWADDNCEVNLQVRVRVVADCSGGTLPGNAPDGAVKYIERRFSASDGNDGVAPGTCTQRIWVVDYEPFYITDNTCNNNNPNDGVIWPCDVLLTDCPEDLGDTGEPTVFDDACSLVGVTYTDQRFDFVDGACFKILRRWAIIDWCQYNSLTGAGLWYYTQVIKVHDNQGPVFADCPSPVTLCVADEGVSLPDNNQAFLGEDNPLSSSCSVHLKLFKTVHETCSDIVNYDVKLYLYNGDEFIYLKTTSTATVDSNNDAELYFDTRQNPSQLIRNNGIPYNSPFCGDYHRILWSAEDGCGNWSHCEYLLRLEDCKQPSPVCINGLSTVVMPIGGQVTVWAKDFNASSFDDCTPEADLLYSFSGDSYQPSYSYTCGNVPAFGTELSVQIWVADGGVDHNCNGQISWAERNKDYCTTTIVITDNNGVCSDTTGSILAGEILTEDVQTVEQVSVNLNSPGHVFPTFITTQNGLFNFNNVILPNDYSITAERLDNPKNGVSTLDLVKIQKHLLGIEPLTSPYDLIAADANNSQSVSAIDLVELRKLILGLYTTLPNNKSWRFVDKSFQFANPTSPWPFDEIIDVTNMTGSQTHDDFVAVKVGDVNNTVQANAQQVRPRNGNGIVHFVADDRTVSKGGMVDLVVRSGDFTSIEGYQFTLTTQGLEFRGIESGIADMNDENIGVFGDMLTASWHKVGGVSATSNDVLFTLHFQATNSGRLSEMINLNSKETQAEAYNTSDDIKDLKLSFRGSENVAEFALYQNEPNPFKGNTVIGYDVPQSGPVTLTVFDVTGKILVVKNQDAVKGYNTITVSSKELPAVGVMYYRVDAGVYSATKKMVLIE